jgi:hypothetical protein
MADLLEFRLQAFAADEGLKNIGPRLRKSVVKDCIYPTLKEIRDYAKKHHRHKTRTGTLKRSIKADYDADGGRVYNDDSCDYLIFVHEGHRSWEPDKFFEVAFDKFDKKLDKKIDQAVNKLLKESNWVRNVVYNK